MGEKYASYLFPCAAFENKCRCISVDESSVFFLFYIFLRIFGKVLIVRFVYLNILHKMLGFYYTNSHVAILDEPPLWLYNQASISILWKVNDFLYEYINISMVIEIESFIQDLARTFNSHLKRKWYTSLRCASATNCAVSSMQNRVIFAKISLYYTMNCVASRYNCLNFTGQFYDKAEKLHENCHRKRTIILASFSSYEVFSYIARDEDN